MEIVKHTGQIINTGKKCVILLLELPERPGYSLIAETDSLPERIHDPLMSILMSNEAQNSKNLIEVLHRRMMPDSNVSILMEMHRLGYLRAEPADNIYIVPRNNIKVRASDVIKELKKIEGKENVEANVVEKNDHLGVESEVRYNFYRENIDAENSEKNIEIAKNMLIQAKLLEEDAKRLREKAYGLAPSLFEEGKNFEANKIENKRNKRKEQKVVEQKNIEDETVKQESSSSKR